LAVLAMSGMAMAQDINLHRNEDGTWSFIMPARNLLMSTEVFSANDPVNGHFIGGVPEGWVILVMDEPVTITEGRTTPITEGAPVTIVPTGNRRAIKSITLMDYPAGHDFNSVVVGDIICVDGMAYNAADYDRLAYTAVAVVRYVDGTGHGLAMALADDGGTMNWNTASASATAHTPTVPNCTWRLPTKNEINQMVNAAGGYAKLRDCFSGIGGTNMVGDKYWTSTNGSTGGSHSALHFGGGNWYSSTNPCHTRACLEF